MNVINFAKKTNEHGELRTCRDTLTLGRFVPTKKAAKATFSTNNRTSIFLRLFNLPLTGLVTFRLYHDELPLRGQQKQNLYYRELTGDGAVIAWSPARKQATDTATATPAFLLYNFLRLGLVVLVVLAFYFFTRADGSRAPRRLFDTHPVHPGPAEF